MMLPGMATELDRREAEPDKRDREDDPTPRPLVRALLAAALPHVPLRWRLTALDVCAGYGVFASELRRHAAERGYQVEITGVEICEARREHLRKWCDRVIIDDWRASHGLSHDLAMGNPHFSALVSDDGDPDQSMPAVLLRSAPAVLLFHQTTSFQRGRKGVAAWRAYPPARVWLVPGSVGFRGPGTQTDSRCYQGSLWLRGHTGPTVYEMLGDLPDGGASWRWTVPPGSEDPSEDLPGVVGWAHR